MTDKLTDNDKQRIEQEAISRFGSPDKGWEYPSVSANYFRQGAEYATIYEREQQAKEQFQKVMDGPYIDFDKDKIFMDGDNNSYSLMTSSDPEKREKGKQIRIHELTSRIKQLEAERSELKTILTILQPWISGIGWIQHEGHFFDMKERILNSLKTK